MKIIQLITVIILGFCNHFSMNAQTVAMSLDKMRVIYIGLKNPITFAVENEKNDKVVVECKEVPLVQEKGNYYLIPNENSARRAIVKVGVKKKKEVKWLDSFELRVRPLPKPYLLFGVRDASTKTITTGELLTIKYLSATLGETFVMQGLQYEITRARISIIGKELIVQDSFNGNRLPYNIREHFWKLQGGDIIYIHDVWVTLKESELLIIKDTFKISPMMIEIRGRAKSEITKASAFRKITNNKDTSDIRPFEVLTLYIDNYLNKKHIHFQFFNFAGELITEQIYENGKIHQVNSFSRSGRLLVQKSFLRDSIFAYSSYYETGQIHQQGRFYRKTNTSCGNFGDRELRKEIEVAQVTSKPIHDSLKEFEEIYECLTGKWKEFHANGKLKQVGEMITIGDNYGLRAYDEDTLKVRYLIVVKHGLWKYYNHNGKLIRTILFDKGKRIKVEDY